MAKICGFPLFVVLSLAILNPSQSEEQQAKTRQKRHWIIPPHKLKENVNYMHLDYIAKIRSDEETSTSIRYSLTGAGADRPPINLFTVGRENGWVKIHGVLDREKIPVYYLQGEARFLNGSRAEQNIDLRIEVEDENDCPPVFNLTIGAVHELSAADTYVMTVIATDADQEGTENSKISYSIIEQSHDQMFHINRDGLIYVSRSTLDREIKDKYTLIVKGTDMGVYANTGTGTVIIHILDVNDNIPTLDKDIYEGSVEENTKFVEVLRIQATDRDLIHTDNWLAVFTIISGNEANYFSITTDNKTNEGILVINKELDYEELKEVSLVVSLSNKAAYHHSVVVTEGRTYTIRVRVKNQPEGPRFKPAVKVITISEESSTIILNTVITNYAAIDSDTLLIATNVRYAKGQDVDNWLIIDEKTADIRLNKKPDYESKFLINGTYYAEIICITNEVPSKTSTGTIAIQVKDFNDHCPVLILQSQTLCYEEHVLYVSAVDKDQFPNAAPFGFKVDTRNTKESWSIEHLDDTTAIFRSQKTLWPGVYQLFVDVWDQQGKICGGQELRVEVCACDATKVCLPKNPVSRFGASGVLLMLLGLLLLLLVPLLLLFCLCGAAGAAADFKTIPFDTKAHLITYNTEGQGEDKGMALLQISKDLDKNKRTTVDSSRWAQKKAEGKGGAHWSTFYQYDQHDAYHHLKHQTDGEFMNAQRKDEYSRFQDLSAFDGLALSDAFLGNYYSQKTSYVAKKHDVGDNLRVYDYEGRESRTGSFEDICSLLHEDDNLAFLDDLDLKFKTLAEICSGSTMERETSTTISVTSKPVQTSSHKETNVQETVNLLQSQEREQSSSTVLAAGAQQSASMSSAGMFVQEKVVVPNTTLLVQHPALYYAPATPIYVVEPQPTLLKRPGPVLGLQEKLLVEEQRGANAAQHGAAKCEMQHYQNVVLVPTKPTKASVQAQSSVSGAVKIVSTEITQSAEAHAVRGSVHSAKRVTPGEAREREVGFLDMRAPQSL